MSKVKYINQKYPLSVFFMNFIDRGDFKSVADFLRSFNCFGERKISEAVTVFYDCMKNGMFSKEFMENFNRAFPEAKDELCAGLNAHKLVMDAEYEEQQKKDEADYRMRFKPYLYIKHEFKMPKQITIVAMCGGTKYWKMVKLPEEFFLIEAEDEQLKKISEIARAYAKSKPNCCMFGKVKSFIFQQTPDVHYKVSLDGKIGGREKKRYTLPIFTWSLG